MKALITGVNGQDGAYLSQLLLEKGYEVHGLIRRGSTAKKQRLIKLEIADKIKFIECELTEVNKVTQVIKDGQYDEIYNLAAQSFVGYSFDSPIYTAEVDGMAVLYQLEAIRHYSPQTRYYQAGTSEMFGQVQEVPQKETTRFYPRSPYGVAKQFAYSMVVNYRESYRLFATNGILFNHESPLRGDEFVTKKITNYVKQYSLGNPPLELGNMDSRRDWGHAKDYVRGMHLMLQHSKPDDFILSTGVTTSVRDFVKKAFELSGHYITFEGKGEDEVGIVDGHVAVQVNKEFYRPAEVDLLIGSSTKAHLSLGWYPEYNLDRMVEEMLTKSN